MKAMILAAGLGQRMRPLTDSLPKPLLRAGNKTLIEHQLARLQSVGITEVVVNTSYLAEKIEQALGDGSQLGMDILYSRELEPLETAGAILQALPLLGEEPFLLLNADVWCEMELAPLLAKSRNYLAHLVLVANPAHHQTGDFSIAASTQLQLAQSGQDSFTYSGIAIINPLLVTGYPRCRSKFPLREVFDYQLEQGEISAEIYSGDWRDIGTPERLQQLNADLAKR